MLWPCRMVDAASRSAGCRARSLPRTRSVAASVKDLRPTPASGRGPSAVDRGSGQSPLTAGCHTAQRGVMRFDTSAALSEFANDYRPKWKRRPAAEAETGDVRRPRSYDLRRITGKLNQPRRGGVPAVV